ncbi:MAG: peptidoglycan-binding protein [Pseudomonadota bacterium]
MDIKAAIKAAAPDAPKGAIKGLVAVQRGVAATGALDNDRRLAHMIGQCAHESLRFTLVSESLFYTTAERVIAIFPRHFSGLSEASQFLRNSEAMANKVYANRMGNGSPQSGDGFRYRGRGYLQLTGKDNYKTFGQRIGLDLLENPDQAAEPGPAWLIAATYLASRSRSGRTALEWADEDNVEMVTRIVNGGTHGLADRRNRTARALAALGGLPQRPLLSRDDVGESVALLQRALAAAGFSPGAIDGHFGGKTEAAVRAFQAAKGLGVDGKVGKKTWKALEPLPA